MASTIEYCEGQSWHKTRIGRKNLSRIHNDYYFGLVLHLNNCSLFFIVVVLQLKSAFRCYNISIDMKIDGVCFPHMLLKSTFLRQM